MSYHSSIRYASLKDAFGEKQQKLVEEARQAPVAEPEPIKTIIQEKMCGDFVTDEVDSSFGIECEVVQKHCSMCGDCSAKLQPKKYGPIGTSLNELLNLILIFLLIWILIFKPKL